MIYFPAEEFSGSTSDGANVGADYLELKAMLSFDCMALRKDIEEALELGGDEVADEESVDHYESIATGAINRIYERRVILGPEYPFDLDSAGDAIWFTMDEGNLGHATYALSLVLSNLPAITPILSGSIECPSNREIIRFREDFQYLATAALAAEVGGPAWSFGFPRLDKSGFHTKLREVWSSVRDGTVNAHQSAPGDPKDDGVDVFAARTWNDGLPGFLLLAAQVATGKGWKEKSVKSQVRDVFTKRWFSPEPATDIIPYHVIPFARGDVEFRDDVVVLGNLLHRLRLPIRVKEASGLRNKGVTIEGFERVEKIAEEVMKYIQRVRSEQEGIG